MEDPAQVQVAPVYHSALSPLREPLFRSLWIAAVISYTGSWMQAVATGWLMTSHQLADVGSLGAGCGKFARAGCGAACGRSGGYY